MNWSPGQIFKQQHKQFLRGLLQPSTPDFECFSQQVNIQTIPTEETLDEGSSQKLWQNFIEEGDSSLDIIAGLNEVFEINQDSRNKIYQSIHYQCNESPQRLALKTMRQRCLTSINQVNLNSIEVKNKKFSIEKIKNQNLKTPLVKTKLKSFLSKYQRQNDILQLNQNDQQEIKTSQNDSDNKYRSQSTECQSISNTKVNQKQSFYEKQIQTPISNTRTQSIQTSSRINISKKQLKEVIDKQLNKSFTQMKKLIVKVSNQQKDIIQKLNQDIISNFNQHLKLNQDLIKSQSNSSRKQVQAQSSIQTNQLNQQPIAVQQMPNTKKQLYTKRDLSNLGFRKRQQLYNLLQSNQQ